MVYDKIIVGKFVDLRSITPDDAEFSYNIRADKRNKDTVGQLAESVDAQRRYIENQMQKPDDYYFVVLNKNGERIGLIGVYDIKTDIAEVGREVNIGEPMETMEVGFLMNKFCIEVLGISRICYVIYDNNPKHLSDAIKRGGIYMRDEMRGTHKALYFEQNITEENETVQKIRKMIDKMYDMKMKTQGE